MHSARYNKYLRSLLILLAVAVVPLLTSWIALSHMFAEQHNARLQGVKQELYQQSVRLPRITSSDYQIISFFNSLSSQGLAARSDEYVARVLDHIDSYYPDCFKWLFWDENGIIRNIESDTIIYGMEIWQNFIEFMLVLLRIVPEAEDYENSEQRLHHLIALNAIQRIMGAGSRAEHLAGAGFWPLSASWFGEKVTFYFAMQAEEYRRDNMPVRMNSGFMLMTRDEILGDSFWLNRAISRRSSVENRLPFPVIALDTTSLKVSAISSELQFPGFHESLLKAYYERTSNEFEFGNYLARLSRVQGSTNKLFISIADISGLNGEYQQMLSRLRIICMIILLIIIIGYTWQKRAMNLTLRLRISLLFVLATSLPVVSLISLGNVYVDHEYNRLIEAAYVNMRSGMESMELRYKDVPRLIEEELYQDLQKVVGEEAQDFEAFEVCAETAVKMGLIEHYLLMDISGKTHATNWSAVDPVVKEIIGAAVRKSMAGDGPGSGSVLRDAIDEEIASKVPVDVILDFSSGNKLLALVYSNAYMNFLGLPIKVAEEDFLMITRIPEYLIEEKFARAEYVQNRLATDKRLRDQESGSAELVFRSRFMAVNDLPESSEVFTQLGNEFFRAYYLRVEESGQLDLEGETFLYLIRPLASMKVRSFIPCLLTSTNTINEALGKVRLIVVLLALLAGVGAIILSLILSSNLIKPISLIDNAAVRVAQGDLDVCLPDLGVDEIGNLSRNFNQMVEGLRQREKMKAYVSDSVVKAVQADAKSIAGSIAEATVLFSDVRNFTGLSEKHGAKAIFSFLNSLMSGLENAIRLNGGRVDKFIGDAVMAVFSQDSADNHTLAAVKAAIAMQHFVDQLNQERSAQGLFIAEIGIGISSGSVLIGEVGSQRRKDMTIIGDEVSLAARLEGASKQGRHSRIMISGTAMQNIANAVEVEKMPFTEIKAKKQEVEIFELVRLTCGEI